MQKRANFIFWQRRKEGGGGLPPRVASVQERLALRRPLQGTVHLSGMPLEVKLGCELGLAPKALFECHHFCECRCR